MAASSSATARPPLAAADSAHRRAAAATPRAPAPAARRCAAQLPQQPAGGRRTSFRLCRSAETETAQEPSAADSQFLDEDAMLAAQGFAIPPEQLIAKAKEFLSTAAANPATMESWLAEDFRFAGPVVGPLGKKELLTALKGFDLLTGFPDLKSNFHHFRACPYEPGRVWFTWRPRGTHTGKLMGAIDATGIEVEAPPQTHSLTFNEDGLITKQTVGYVNDRELGNTGGLGGIYGIFYAVGSPLPFPEANPWKKSKRYTFFQWISSFNRPKDGQ